MQTSTQAAVTAREPDRWKRAVAYAADGYSAMQAGRTRDAIASYHLALSEWPDFPEVLNNLGRAILSLGKVDEAIPLFRRALETNPDLGAAHSNLLTALLHSPQATPDAIYRAHRDWGLKFGVSQKPRVRRRTDRAKLRLGYVSGNFRFHPEVFFLEPVLHHHDRDKFEVYCYSNVEHGDAFTEICRTLADHWCDIHAMSDDQAAARIRRDGIDLLIDCGGHFAGGRLSLFSKQPAPVQISYPSYPATTGLPQIGYRITDSIVDPDGVTDHLHTEKLVRLHGVYCCYETPHEAPRVNKLPAIKNDAVTFGAFNRPHKVTESAIEVWATILREVPGSRIIFHHALPLNEDVADMLESRGIERSRIEFVGRLSLDEHLALFHRIDIALDTFPYNGMTTTCESLWMGVPVLTLAGDSHVSRVGMSLLTATGLQHLIARSPREYARIAITLARDTAHLAVIRAGLRHCMRGSRLTRGAAYTRDLERAYLSIWKGTGF